MGEMNDVLKGQRTGNPRVGWFKYRTFKKWRTAAKQKLFELLLIKYDSILKHQRTGKQV
jgi:hypothetical protein